MDKWEKSIVLIRLLRQHRCGVSLETIKEELECSKQTFYRVKEYTQSMFGVAIKYDPRYQRYLPDLSPDQELTLPEFWFKQDEIAAFILFSSLLEGIHDGFLKELLEPIKKRFVRLLRAQNITEAQWYNRIKYCSIGAKPVDDSILKTAAAASVQRKRLRIKHSRFASDEIIGRTISPQKLVLYRDNWYLDAWCHTKNALRTFALDRIVEIEQLSTGAYTIAEKELQAHFEHSYGIFSGSDTVWATIRFAPGVASEIKRQTWHHLQKITVDQTDGSLTLELPYTNSRELLMDILRWGERAQVIAPECLKKEISEIVSKMALTYGIAVT